MLHKSGRFANLWSLKPEYLESNGTGSAEVAPDANPDDASEADAGEDEESIKMEDVLPS